MTLAPPEPFQKHFDPYPRYMETGNKWLYKIPENWSMQKIKYFVSFVSGGTPSTEEAKYWNGELPWCSSKDMKKGIIEDTEDTITEAAVQDGKTGIVNEGDVLLVVRSGILRHTIPVAISARRLAINQDIKGIIFNKRPYNSRYFAYMIHGNQEPLLAEWRKQGATVESLELDLIANTEIPVPSLEEQQSIVTFLDRETSMIDEMIAKKERLIALLEEKRNALISHVVTKGLAPKIPMKESGIDWLGVIPSHWNLKRLRHISPNLCVGLVINPSTYVDDNGDVPFLFGGNIREFYINAEDSRRITMVSNQILSASMLRENDIVCVRVGYPGVSAVIPRELHGANCASMMIVRRSLGFDSWYLCYCMNSRIGRYQVELVQYGAAQKQFNINHAVNFVFPIPPLEEQKMIANYLKQETNKISDAIASNQKLIGLLKERRITLISSAVTGKIDVHGN